MMFAVGVHCCVVSRMDGMNVGRLMLLMTRRTATLQTAPDGRSRKALAGRLALVVMLYGRGLVGAGEAGQQ